jgi:hypothetical protein
MNTTLLNPSSPSSARLPRGSSESSFRREPLPLPAGNSFLRLLTARTIASVRRCKAGDVAAALWPNDKIIEQLVTRAVAPPAMTTVAGWAAELAHKVIADAVEALAPVSAGARLLQAGLVLTFDRAAIVSVPGFVASANAGGFVAEGAPIPVRQFPATAAQLQPYKLASIGVLTREMIESSNAEQLISDVLRRSLGLALDLVLFDANASTAARPAGLRNGIAASAPSASAEPFGAFFEDMATLLNAVGQVGGPGPYAVVSSVGRIASMRLRFITEDPNLVLLGSAAVGTDMLAVACAGLVAALDPDPELETANAASLHMEDTTPAPLGTASPARSLFQTDTIAIKVRWPVSWAIRDSRAIAWLTPTWK